jgi:hypothetical protein
MGLYSGKPTGWKRGKRRNNGKVVYVFSKIEMDTEFKTGLRPIPCMSPLKTCPISIFIKRGLSLLRKPALYILFQALIIKEWTPY